MRSKVLARHSLVAVVVAAGVSACALGEEDTGDQADAISSPDMAKTVFLRLTGTGLQENDPRFATMVQAIDQGHSGDAARIATADPNFYGVVLRNWSAPWSSVDGALDNEFDDLQALATRSRPRRPRRDGCSSRARCTTRARRVRTSPPTTRATTTTTRRSRLGRSICSSSLTRHDEPAIAGPRVRRCAHDPRLRQGVLRRRHESTRRRLRDQEPPLHAAVELARPEPSRELRSA